MAGFGWRSLPPAVLPSFGVGPSPFGAPPAATRSMPIPPFTSMRLPRMETARAPGSTTTPAPLCMMTLSAIVVGSVASAPVLRTAMPAPTLSKPDAVPSGEVPIALQVIVVADAGAESEMASPSNRRKMKPLITVPVPPETMNPEGVAFAPSRRTGSAGGPGSHETALGCVVASIETCSVMAGSGDANVMVCAPESGISNVMVSAPGLAFASRMACRRDPTPSSSMLVTTKLAAFAETAGRNSSPAIRDRQSTTLHACGRESARPNVGRSAADIDSTSLLPFPPWVYRPEVGHSWSASVRFSSQRRAHVGSARPWVGHPT